MRCQCWQTILKQICSESTQKGQLEIAWVRRNMAYNGPSELRSPQGVPMHLSYKLGDSHEVPTGLLNVWQLIIG